MLINYHNSNIKLKNKVKLVNEILKYLSDIYVSAMTWLKVGLFLIGKLGVVICFTGIYTYSLELFPTSVRGSLLGWGNTAARIGSMLAPLTPLLVSKKYQLVSHIQKEVLFSRRYNG